MSMRFIMPQSFNGTPNSIQIDRILCEIIGTEVFAVSHSCDLESRSRSTTLVSKCRVPPLGKFSGRGDFSLGVNMGSNSTPPKTLSDESINQGLVCAHMHFIARTQKIPTFMS